MSRNLRPTLAAVALATVVIMLAGCYHTIIDTGRPPGPQVYRESFKPAFINGLVPAKVDARQWCGAKGFSKIETQYSFLNLIVGAVTLGIFTPMDVRVVCAA